MANKSDVCIVFRNTEELDGSALELAASHLSIEERDRRDRLHFQADRREFTIAHDLLRQTLSRHATISPSDWRFDINSYGKPSIASPDEEAQALSFSLSHTRGCVACAITFKAPLGIDLERIDRSLPVQEIADRYFTEEESAWLHGCSNELRNICFTELWTLKEAFVKSIGTGLSVSLKTMSFRFEEQASIAFSRAFDFLPQEWHFALFEPCRDIRLAVAVQSAAEPNFIIRSYDGKERPLTPIRRSTATALPSVSGAGLS